VTDQSTSSLAIAGDAHNTAAAAMLADIKARYFFIVMLLGR
jgi:hypothetical protein